jgi:hypothetical protein
VKKNTVKYLHWTPISSLGKTGIPVSTLRRWCSSGRIRARKFGRKWYLYVPDLLTKNGFDLLADEIVRS